ncbi:hypothetical protein R3I93_009027 [Phoxinus phoxinus]|uniref:CARD domain-containing protein n=1 Tax=Phoxinus phoxinus TaxID=58324 RepID=A0AAN9D825_9TELE
MDSTVVIFPDQQLQQHLGFLSKCMTGILVQRMSNCLYRSRTITAYESQVITAQATDMQKVSKMMQIVIKKGQSACSSFLRCLGICDPALYENVTGYPAQFGHEDHQQEIPFSEKMQFTPCIINIQNSSLNNCIIGNNNRQCITCDQHSLLARNDAIKETVDEMAATQSNDEVIPVRETISGNSIHMERSNIEYVIIGDHNSMTVTECLNSEAEEDTETEPDVIV